MQESAATHLLETGSQALTTAAEMQQTLSRLQESTAMSLGAAAETLNTAAAAMQAVSPARIFESLEKISDSFLELPDLILNGINTGFSGIHDAILASVRTQPNVPLLSSAAIPVTSAPPIGAPQPQPLTPAASGDSGFQPPRLPDEISADIHLHFPDSTIQVLRDQVVRLQQQGRTL